MNNTVQDAEIIYQNDNLIENEDKKPDNEDKKPENDNYQAHVIIKPETDLYYHYKQNTKCLNIRDKYQFPIPNGTVISIGNNKYISVDKHYPESNYDFGEIRFDEEGIWHEIPKGVYVTPDCSGLCGALENSLNVCISYNTLVKLPVGLRLQQIDTNDYFILQNKCNAMIENIYNPNLKKYIKDKYLGEKSFKDLIDDSELNESDDNKSYQKKKLDNKSSKKK